MKRYIFTTSLSIIIVLFSLDVIAGQYVKISKIDAESTYPRIIIYAEISLGNSINRNLDVSNISLNEDDNRITEEVKIDNTHSEEEYLYLIFSIDSSKSISSSVLKKIKALAAEMVSMLGVKDKLAVYRFDNSVTLLNDFSRDEELLVKNINKINRHGKKTLLYDAIHDSLELFENVKQKNRKIIVFTDGKDEGSTVSEQRIIQLGYKSGIPIYFICFQKTDNIQGLARISRLTGGKLICSSRHDDIIGMYKTIFLLIKNRFKISYKTSLNQDGLKHKIEIRLNNGEIRDRDSVNVHFPKVFKFTGWFSNNYLYILILSILLIITLLFMIMIILIKEKKLLITKLSSEEMKQAGIPSQAAPKDLIKNNFELDRTGEELIDNTEESYVNAWIYHKIGSGIGNKFLINTAEVSIGRDAGNDIIIHDDLINKHHAKIKNILGVFYLFDLISESGTFLNGKKLLRPKMLYDWDEIILGKSTLIFRGSKRPH